AERSAWRGPPVLGPVRDLPDGSTATVAALSGELISVRSHGPSRQQGSSRVGARRPPACAGIVLVLIPLVLSLPTGCASLTKLGPRWSPDGEQQQAKLPDKAPKNEQQAADDKKADDNSFSLDPRGWFQKKKPPDGPADDKKTDDNSKKT